jgi:LacI family transcriptional regulator
VDERLLLFNTGGFPADGAESAERLLNCPEPPTAIFAATDYRAIGVLQKLEEMSIRVPLDMSVIGFDNIIESVHSVPALSTIENPLYQSGFEAVKMLYRKIREPSSAPESVVLPTHLIVRNSTSQFRPA